MSQVFPAAIGAKRKISRSAYLLFIAGVGLLGCSAVVLAITFADTERLAPSNILVATIIGLGCVGLAGLAAGIATLIRLRLPIEVEVTPHRLIWREGKRLATLEYEEVERVDLVRGEKRMRGSTIVNFPVVRFIENDGEMMEFEISFEDRDYVYHSRFDARAITEAVLPYLQQQAVIAHEVDEFVHTGMIDIDHLPER